MASDSSIDSSEIVDKDSQQIKSAVFMICVRRCEETYLGVDVGC